MQTALPGVTVVELVGQARAAYPQFAVDPGAFARHLAACSASGGSAPKHCEEVYLAFACAAGDRGALALFERRYLSQVAHYVAHLHAQASFIDEVRQRLRERMLVGSARTGRR